MANYEEQSKKIAERMGNIKRKIGIMSGKGGVGKSMLSALLASSFSKSSKVGLLDADITGPSIPKMFGINKSPEGNDGAIIPPETKKGLKIISMNLFLDHEDSPVIWRGPLLGNTVRQFLSDVEWGELDYLFIDFPPGTGDIPLSIMQSVKLDGIIFVTTPQDLAMMIVKKTINMAGQLGVPIIGIIENMSYFSCTKCGEKQYPFGSSKISEAAKELGIPVIGNLPIDSRISSCSDQGTIEEYETQDISKICTNIKKRLNT